MVVPRKRCGAGVVGDSTEVGVSMDLTEKRKPDGEDGDGAPSWAFPGPFALCCKILPQCLPAAFWRIATMSGSICASSEPSQGSAHMGVQNPVPAGLIHTGLEQQP